MDLQQFHTLTISWFFCFAYIHGMSRVRVHRHTWYMLCRPSISRSYNLIYIKYDCIIFFTWLKFEFHKIWLYAVLSIQHTVLCSFWYDDIYQWKMLTLNIFFNLSTPGCCAIYEMIILNQVVNLNNWRFFSRLLN